MYVWKCTCGYKNTDSRKSFLICIECGKTYEVIPTPYDVFLDEEMRKVDS